MGLTEGSIFSGFPAIASPLAQFIVQLIVILGFTRLRVFMLKPLKQVRRVPRRVPCCERVPAPSLSQQGQDCGVAQHWWPFLSTPVPFSG
jgi:hypothetical protein